LTSVFYVPNQVVPRIGAQPPYSNALPTVTVEQKHKNRNSNLKKRKMKIRKSENQRKIENRDRKSELKRGGISEIPPILYSSSMWKIRFRIFLYATILSANSCGMSANASKCLADEQFM
jgi:hypothetical protein